MTETLFQKLEEKMMLVLSEVESLRNEVQHLRQENTTMKFEKDNNTNKLQGLLSLLDTMNLIESSVPPSMEMPMAKPVLVQG